MAQRKTAGPRKGKRWLTETPLSQRAANDRFREMYRVPPRHRLRGPARIQRDRHRRNLTARLCGGAGDSQILISSRVLSKIENGIDVESLGELALKGFNRPIPAYNVLTERPEA